jgi:hypothetical protein
VNISGDLSLDCILTGESPRSILIGATLFVFGIIFGYLLSVSTMKGISDYSSRSRNDYCGSNYSISLSSSYGCSGEYTTYVEFLISLTIFFKGKISLYRK